MRSDNVENANETRSGGNGGPNATSSSTPVGAKAEEAAERLKTATADRFGQVREKVEEQKNQISERVHRVTSALRNVGEQLREEDDLVARYADRAAGSLERAADYLTSMDPREMADDVKEYARKRPALFFGGAFLLGLAAGRFVKSSQASGGGSWSGESLEGEYGESGYREYDNPNYDVYSADTGSPEYTPGATRGAGSGVSAHYYDTPGEPYGSRGETGTASGIGGATPNQAAQTPQTNQPTTRDIFDIGQDTTPKKG